MTLGEAVLRVKADRPGEATDTDLVKWLSDLDTRWSMEVIDTHWPISRAYERRVEKLLKQIVNWVTSAEEEEEEDEDDEPYFLGYDNTTDDDTVLLIPSPDDEIYIYWLYSKIDMRLGEIARYNNDAMLYNAAWNSAAKRFNRTHMPKGEINRHIVYGSMPVPRRAPDDPLDQRLSWFERW